MRDPKATAVADRRSIGAPDGVKNLFCVLELYAQRDTLIEVVADDRQAIANMQDDLARLQRALYVTAQALRVYACPSAYQCKKRGVMPFIMCDAGKRARGALMLVVDLLTDDVKDILTEFSQQMGEGG